MSWAAHASGVMNDRRIEASMPPLVKHIRPGMRVLDVGCGPGAITRDIARLAAPGEVIGMDLEPTMVARATEVAAAAGLTNVRFMVGNAGRLPFDADTFDVVYSHAVLDWVASPEVALREQFRVAVPGGAVFMTAADLECRILYPPCPTVMSVIRMLREESEEGRHNRPWNPFLGGRVLELLQAVGAVASDMEATATTVHQGKAPLTPTLAMPWWPLDSPLVADPIRSLTARGILTPAVRAAVDAELDAWCRHPAALMVRPRICAWGFKPVAATR